jgi:REP element-mobilizing transposase RayT
MKFSEDSLYHIYNRGNNQQRIFFTRENYFYFLQKARTYLEPCADFLAWCLMPNHFHFLIQANVETCRKVQKTNYEISSFSEGMRKTLSSYTKGLQIQQRFTGSLFQQKTKCKCLDKGDYGERVFHYIHQNPVRAGLVKKMEDWEFSSFRDYAALRNGSFCNKALAFDIFGFENRDFIDISSLKLSEKMMGKIRFRI